MATSGTFTGSRSGGTTGPRLLLDWSRVETDISGNRSKIRLTLKLDIDGRINFSTNKTGSLHGSSFTFTGGISASSTTRTLQTRDVWVNHNSDGSKTQSFSASFNIAISYSGTNISSLSVSGNASIDSIPRASGFTAFSLSSTTVNTSTANTVTYTLDRKASGFSHNMTLKLGNKTIKSWSDSGTGNRTSSLTAAQVNEIIKGRPNNTSGTLTLTMQTRSGSTNIGSSVSRTMTFSISTDVSPSASGITAAISGSGRDKTINRFVQNITKVTSSFTSSAGYGAKVSSRSIVIRRVSGAANSQTISGSSGTTGNAVSLNGTYEAIGTIKDSRGRSATSRTTFTVQAYSVPAVTKFTAFRNKTTPTTVNITRAGSWSSLGTGTASLNNLTISVQRRLSTSTSWTSVQSTTGNTGSFTGSVNSTGNSEASSYEFRITVTDTFGKKATSTVKVGTSFLELTISKGKGIGVGKIHERGSLDVRGEMFLEGTIHLPKDFYRSKPGFSGGSDGGGINANNSDIYGLNGIWFGADGNDTANNDGEGLIFPRSSTPANSTDYREWDTFRVLNGAGLLNGNTVFDLDKAPLWTGNIPLHGSQSVTPSKSILDCPNGWMLVWSSYQDNSNWEFSFIPKAWRMLASWQGGISVPMMSGSIALRKYFYLKVANKLEGYSGNQTSPNDLKNLRYVFAF